MEKCLSSIKSENTKNAILAINKKLEKFMESIDIKDIRELTSYDVDTFLKAEYTGKSETTVSNIISRIKILFSYFDNRAAVKHLSLHYFEEITQVKENEYLTPEEVYNIIESLLNYQDKALVLLTYIGLYDNDFNTIRHLRKDQFKDGILYLDNKTIKLNSYCKHIIENTIKEEQMEKYIFQEGRKSNPYKLNNDTPYILKSKLRKGSADILPSITLKKRFEIFGRYMGVNKLSAIMLKNSKQIYDIIKLEYEENLGMDINQIALKDYCKENFMTGQVEKLNMAKKKIKFKIIKEIIDGKTFFID